jgi:hypothetical protein
MVVDFDPWSSDKINDLTHMAIDVNGSLNNMHHRTKWEGFVWNFKTAMKILFTGWFEMRYDIELTKDTMIALKWLLEKGIKRAEEGEQLRINELPRTTLRDIKLAHELNYQGITAEDVVAYKESLKNKPMYRTGEKD